jgi:hypothetical protein
MACSRAAAEWDQGFLVLDDFELPLNFGVVSLEPFSERDLMPVSNVQKTGFNPR